MASTSDRAYTDPNFNVRRENPHIAGGAATTAYGRDIAFQARRLKALHAQVITPGTATTHALNLYVGTSSIGAISISTATAGSNFSLQGLDRLVPSLAKIEVRTAADASGIAAICYEFDIDPSAAQSV